MARNTLLSLPQGCVLDNFEGAFIRRRNRRKMNVSNLHDTRSTDQGVSFLRCVSQISREKWKVRVATERPRARFGALRG
jgi:hypothetical protein